MNHLVDWDYQDDVHTLWDGPSLGISLLILAAIVLNGIMLALIATLITYSL